MEELLVTIAKGLVEDKGAVSVTADAPDEDGIVVYHLHVGADDMGRRNENSGRNRLELLTKAERDCNKRAGGISEYPFFAVSFCFGEQFAKEILYEKNFSGDWENCNHPWRDGRGKGLSLVRHAGFFSRIFPTLFA